MCFDKIHIGVYCEIVQGKYFPEIPRFSNRLVLENLVLEAQTTTVAVISAGDNPNAYLGSIDLLAFGYKNKDDYLTEVVKRPDGKLEIQIRPVKIYELHERIKIPLFGSIKSKYYCELICDEFERIKIRAGWMLEYCNDRDLVCAYALKHIQKAKQLFAESKRALNEIQETMVAENIYILIILNIFIVRTILFYQHLFRPYINAPEEKKEIMFFEILEEISFSKIDKILKDYLMRNLESLQKSFLGNTADPGISMLRSFINCGKTFSNNMKTNENIGNVKYQPIKINGQINVLVDIFTQLIDQQRTPDGPFLETSRENLEAFLVANFVDRNNKPLSSPTINTLLKTYRVDKHIKQDNPKRIDLSSHFETEE